MDANDLKKTLAGLCIASLISGSSLVLSGCAGKSAGSGEKVRAGSSQSG